MKRLRILLLAAGLFAGTAASAQFYQNGTDPFGRWSERESAQAELDALYERWEKLSEEAEA